MKIDIPHSEGDEINLAPLIDCVFLLLIFFMVSTTFDQADEPPIPTQELLVQLPTASASIATNNLSQPVVIGIDKSGSYSIDGRYTSVSEIHKQLKQLAKASPNRRIRIDGDKDAAYKDVVHILDLCQFVGLQNIGARTR